MDISLKAWIILDTIHKPHEAQEEGDQSVDTSFLLRKGNKISMGGDTERKVWSRDLRKGYPETDYPTWGSIPYMAIKPRYYCGFQQVLADRSFL